MQANRARNNLKQIVVGILAVLTCSAGFSQNSAGQSSAAIAAQESDKLDEIVVTAQKIKQSISKVPLAVSAVDGDTLERTQVSTIENLRFIAPSLSFSQSTSRRGAGMGIRGLSTLSFSDGIEQSVGTVVDGVVLGRQAQGFSDFFDVERIEVLRGPQGTLFGKNASAGVINIITNSPSDQLEAKADVSIGNANDRRANAVISGPFSDTLAGRLSVRYQDRDGFTDNVTSGERTDGEKEFGLRGKLRLAASDDFSLNFAMDYGRSDSECCNLITRSASPGFLAAFVRNVAFAGGPRNAIVPSISNREVSVDAKTGTEDHGGGASVTAEWQTGFGSMTSITALRDFTVQDFVDVDQGPRNIFNTSGTLSDIQQKSQEFRISGTSNSALTYLAGLYFFDQTLESSAQFGGRLQAAPFTPGGVGAPVDLLTRLSSEVDTRSLAAFGQMSYQFDNALSLTAGLRFTREDLEIRQSQIAGFPLIGAGVNYTLPSPALPNAITEVDDSDLSGKLALGYAFSDATNGFISYTRGYKGPGFNALFLGSANQAQTFAPIAAEIPTQIEAGLRTRMLDDRLDLGLTVFSTTIKDFQAQATRLNVLGFLTVNAGEQKTKGVEFEARAKPMAGVDVYFNAAYIDAKFTQFANAQCYPGQTATLGCAAGVQNLAGQRLNNAPELSGNFGVQYNFAWGGSHAAYVRGEVSSRSDVIYALNQNPRTRQGGFSLSNVYLGTSLGDSFEVSLYARNVFDKNYAETIFQTPLDNLFSSQVLGNPRTYGLRVSWFY